MGPFASRLWGLCLVHFAPARSCQESPWSPCSACISSSLNRTWRGQVPSLLPLLTLEHNFCWGCQCCLWLFWAAAGPGLCRRSASHAAFQFMVEQECISQKPCLISPGDCWCLKPSTQIFIWLAVRASKNAR